MSVENRFFHLAGRVTTLAGSPWAFVLAVILVVVWTLTGPLFGFSDSWQLIANTTTTLITFLMVFVIQHAQNRETRAMQLKLNELLAALDGASNRLIDAEELDAKRFDELCLRFHHLAEAARHLRPGAHVSIEDPDLDNADEVTENDILDETTSVQGTTRARSRSRNRQRVS